MIKKQIIGLGLFAIILTACHKNAITPITVTPPGQPSLIGQWKVDTVTTYFYDSTGLRGSNLGYPSDPNIFALKFRFDVNHTWNETLTILPTQDSLYILATGVYTNTSDSTFTLVYANAAPNTTVEDYKILSLTDHLLFFSKQRPTLFNGVDSGYIKYVFRLSK